jgi:hypothetical protein
LILHHRRGSPGFGGAREKIVPVVAAAAQRDEQRPPRQRARVRADRLELAVLPAQLGVDRARGF